MQVIQSGTGTLDLASPGVRVKQSDAETLEQGEKQEFHTLRS